MVNCCFSAVYAFTAILQKIFNCSKIKNIILLPIMSTDRFLYGSQYVTMYTSYKL